MRVYITKYALTHGIIEADAKRDREDPSLIQVKTGKGMRKFRPADWFNHKTDAKKRCEEMRDLKLMSLKNQTDRVAQIKF